MTQRTHRARSPQTALVVLALVVTAFVATTTAVSPASAAPASLHGHVLSSAGPMPMLVGLFESGGEGATATQLGSTVSAADGSFDIAYTAPADPNAVLYVLATTPIPTAGLLTFATVLGTSPADDIVVNERTTVATGYAMSRFIDNFDISGRSPGLQNAASMFRNLVDVATGDIGTVLATAPNGATTDTLNTFNSLANMVATCLAAPANCTALFTLATPPGGVAPNNTLQAIVNINHNPWQNTTALLALAALAPTPYTPVLGAAPDAWNLALRFIGDGHSVDGPGNIAIDHKGNVWVTNNYEFGANPLVAVCGGKTLLAFAPNGTYLPGAPFSGGGLNGAGFGIDIDPYGDIWVGNFGFAAPVPDCPADRQPPHDSVSEFTLGGAPLSPNATTTSTGGFTQKVSWPQGMKSDPQGNIWIANCEADSVTLYPNGNPAAAREFTDLGGLHKPFDLDLNLNGDVFVTGVASNAVAMLHPDGSFNTLITTGIDRPMGIVADSQGNQWVANSGLIDLPCPALDDFGHSEGSLAMISADGAHVTTFHGGGLAVPWSVSVDGNDHIWVANFAQQRVSEFCGIKVSTCPPGKTTGDPISPDVTGYGWDGYARQTATATDPSGNVWITSNWKEVPVQTNPGGLDMVVLVGAAAPVNRAAPAPRPTVVAPPRFTG